MMLALIRTVTKVCNGRITQRGNEAFIRKVIADETAPKPLRNFASKFHRIQETSTNVRNYLSIIEDPKLRQELHEVLELKRDYEKMTDLLFSSVEAKKFLTSFPTGAFQIFPERSLVAKTLIFLNVSLFGLEAYLYCKKELSQTSQEEMEDAAPPQEAESSACREVDNWTAAREGGN